MAFSGLGLRLLLRRIFFIVPIPDSATLSNDFLARDVCENEKAGMPTWPVLTWRNENHRSVSHQGDTEELPLIRARKTLRDAQFRAEATTGSQGPKTAGWK